jgi:hypothetical protein
MGATPYSEIGTIGAFRFRVETMYPPWRGEIQMAEKEERAEGVTRMLQGDDAPEDTDREGQVGPTGGGGGEMAPEGVGESVAHRGENMTAEEGKEAGRYDLGTQGPTNRPVGGSTARDSTGVDPQEPIIDTDAAPTGMGSAS